MTTSLDRILATLNSAEVGSVERIAERMQLVATDLRAIEQAIGKRLPRVTVADFDYSARATERFEVPIADRIAEIRKRKSEERARAKVNAERRSAHGTGGRPAGGGHGRPAGGNTRSAGAPGSGSGGHGAGSHRGASRPGGQPGGGGAGRPGGGGPAGARGGSFGPRRPGGSPSGPRRSGNR